MGDDWDPFGDPAEAEPAPTAPSKSQEISSKAVGLECPKRAFRLRIGRRFWEHFNVFFTTKNLQLVYPTLWQGPFNENPYTKLRLGRSKVLAGVQMGTPHLGTMNLS